MHDLKPWLDNHAMHLYSHTLAAPGYQYCEARVDLEALDAEPKFFDQAGHWQTMQH